MPKTDDELMICVSRGDTNAFAALFERYKADVINFLYRQCGDYSRAEDVAQECFIRIFKNSGSYKPEGKFRNWLMTVAVNLYRSSAVKLSEKNKPEPIENCAGLKDDTRRPHSDIEMKEMQSVIQNALNNLPPEQREVVVLRHFQDMKFDEISIVLDCPVDTVKSRMRYGLLKLFESLKGTGYEL